MREDVAGVSWSKKHYAHGYTSYGSLDRLHEFSSQFETLRKMIDSVVKTFVKESHWRAARGQLFLSKMWANVMEQGAAHSSHLHPYSVLSGTFYVTVPARGGAIRFEDPRFSSFMNRPQIMPEAPAALQNFYSVQPRIGDVLLFESWLRHEVLPSKAKTPRVSVSFNYDWKN